MRFHTILFICIILVFLWNPAAAKSAEAGPVTIYYFERMPFFGNMGEANEGFIIKITRLIFQDAGVPYRFEKMPITRIFENLKQPGQHCIAGGFKTPEREILYSYSRYAIYQDGPPHYVIRRTDQKIFASVTTIDSLLRTKMVLGRVEKYSYGNWVDSHINRIIPRQLIVNIGDDQSNFFRMLLTGRFDYLFSGEEEAAYNISMNTEYKNNLAVKKMTDSPEGNIRWLILNKNFPAERLNKINNSILKVKKSAKYKKIITEAKRR